MEFAPIFSLKALIIISAAIALIVVIVATLWSRE